MEALSLSRNKVAFTSLTIDVYVLKINCNPAIYWCDYAIHHGSIVAEQEQSGIHNIFDYRRLCVKD